MGYIMNGNCFNPGVKEGLLNKGLKAISVHKWSSVKNQAVN